MKYSFDTEEENLKAYNQTTAPAVDLKAIHGVPIVIIGGTEDLLVSVKDLEWVIEQLEENVVFYGEYNLGHLSFMVANDMSYFSVDVMSYIKLYHPIETK
jgi:homoserine acetyltransferase